MPESFADRRRQFIAVMREKIHILKDLGINKMIKYHMEDGYLYEIPLERTITNGVEPIRNPTFTEYKFP